MAELCVSQIYVLKEIVAFALKFVYSSLHCDKTWGGAQKPESLRV